MPIIMAVDGVSFCFHYADHDIEHDIEINESSIQHINMCDIWMELLQVATIH